MTGSRRRTAQSLRMRALRVPLCALFLVIGFAACSSADRARSDSAVAETGAGGGQDDHAEEGEHAEGTDRVTLTEAALQTAQIRVDAAIARTGDAANEGLVVPGQVEFDPRRVALISPRTAGRIERLAVVEGDRVRAGQTVALLYSASYVTAQNDLVQAVKRARLLEGTADAEGAVALVEAARRRLGVFGASRTEISRLEAGGEPSNYLAITAPFGGRILEAHTLTGAAVEAGQEIFTLADLSVVDVVAEVPERSLPLVVVGQRATVGIAAYPSMRFEGRVERLRGELNPETRTVRAVIHVPNPSGRLRPGMFATVELRVPASAVAPGTSSSGSASSAWVSVPESAVVSEGERRFLFIEVGPRTFERREVEIASLAAPGSAAPTVTRVIVRRGLNLGERVVVEGAFILKSELAKAGLGEHGH